MNRVVTGEKMTREVFIVVMESPESTTYWNDIPVENANAWNDACFFVLLCSS